MTLRKDATVQLLRRTGQRSSKPQTSTRRPGWPPHRSGLGLELEIWSFSGAWCLGLGALVRAVFHRKQRGTTNGDGKADVREVVLTGFRLGVTDSNVNGLRWGLDNRVHGANGGNGGILNSPRQPGRSADIRNLDFSFDPATGDFTPTYYTGGGFGLVFDDWGRSFTTYNVNHIQQRIIPGRYLNRFPGMPPLEATESISDHGEAGRIYPISTPETRVNHPEQAGHFSAAGGMGIINSGVFGGDLPGSLLVCDVVGNLVHRDVLKESGPAFIASRSPDEAKREFFASRDNSFRPVGIETGPDGALYLLDMQRDVIEHPDYIPEKVKEKLNLRAGEDRGRIYRITPRGGLPFRKPRLSKASSLELVRELSNSNQWWRMTAQRLLVQRQDKSVVPALKRLAASAVEPLGRLHALWTLEGLHALEVGAIRRALNDPHPGVREQGLILAENHVSDAAEIRSGILALTSDPSPRVRFQTALTIGSLPDANSNAALLKILLRDYEFRWTRVAVLSSLRSGAEDFLQSLLSNVVFVKDATEAKRDLIHDLASIVGARAGPGSVSGLTSLLTTLGTSGIDNGWRTAVLDGIYDGITRTGRSLGTESKWPELLEKISADDSPALLASAWKLSRALGVPETGSQSRALARAMDAARQPALAVESRVANIRLLGLGNFSTVKAALFGLLEGTEPTPVQLAVIETLRQFAEPEVAQTLIARWRSLGPGVRTPVIQLLLQRRPFHEFLLAAIESDKIKLGELNLDLEQRRELLRESSPEIQARAAKLLGDEEYSNRKAVVTEWLAKLPANGDAQRGRAVFEKTCAPCHAVNDLGNHVGPDLTDASHRSVEDLASNILDPNMAINPNYVSYFVETDSGELETGILQSESAEAVTLLQAQGKKVVVPRRKIKRLEASGLSLMPEGLEAGFTPTELRDLIAFLQEKR